MKRRPPQTTIDYMIVALSPVLIMFLVGSLAFFLILVGYTGDFPGRFRLVCALFVMAATLCCRLSIEEGAAYAQLFAFPLAIVTLLAMLRFVDASLLIDMLLIAIVWWSAYKLTWDCTVVDDKVTASGNGLLETVGLDPVADDTADEDDGPVLAKEDLPATSNRDEPAEEPSFWQRFARPTQRNHSSGVWVVYFAMASLPLFGLGQIMLGEHQRAEGFRLLVIYVASAFGLLMTTSLLQLRRYLRQRNIQMPDAMAGRWLGTGTIIALGVMMVCMLLPLPTPDYSLTGIFRKLLSPDNLKASNWGFGNEGVEDEAQPGRAPSEESQRDSDQTRDGAKSDETQSGNGEKQQSGKSDSNQQGGSNSSGDDNDASRQQSDNNRREDRSQSNSNERNSNRQNDENSESQKENGNGSNDSNRPDARDQQSSRSQSNESQSDKSQSESPSSGQNQAAQNQTAPPSESSPFKGLTALWNGLGSILQLLYWLAFLGLVGFFAWKYRHQVIAALSQFIQSIRDFLIRLFSGGRDAAAVDDEDDAPAEPPPPPFAAYRNPFADGTANQWPLNRLVSFSFEALEAWAREHGCPRSPDQTPGEFAAQVGRRTQSLARPAARLAKLYNQIAYDRDQPANASNLETVRQLWTMMA